MTRRIGVTAELGVAGGRGTGVRSAGLLGLPLILVLCLGILPLRARAEPEPDRPAPFESPFVGRDGRIRALVRPEFRAAPGLHEDLRLFAIEGLTADLVGPMVAAPNPADPPLPSRILLAGEPEVVARGREILGYLDVPHPSVVVSLLATEVQCDYAGEIGGHVLFDRTVPDGPNTMFRGLYSEFEPASYLRSSLTQQRPWQGTSVGFGNVGKDILEDGAFEIVLRMLAHERRAEFLAWPTVVCTEGQPGIITSVAQARQNVIDGSTPDGLSISTLPTETGIHFEVLPVRIGSDAAVLELIADLRFAMPEDEDGMGAGELVLHRRRVKTQLVIRDQESLLIGGLKIRRRMNETRGLPVLTGIPGLTSMSKDCLTTELILLVKARVIVPDRGAGLFVPPGEARRLDAANRREAARTRDAAGR